MTPSLLRIALFALLAVATTPGQSTWVVQGGGSALQIAVDRAAVGDVLLVRAGSYQPTVVSKGLVVRCDPGVFFGAAPNGPALSLAAPLGQTLLWDGGDVFGPSPQVVSLVLGGVGLTHVAGMRVTGVAGLAGRRMSLRRCTTEAIHLGSPSTFIRATLADCAVTGQLTVQSAHVDFINGSVDARRAYPLPVGIPAINLLGPGVLTLAGSARVISNAPAGTSVPAVDARGGTVIHAPSVLFVHSTPRPVVGAASESSRWLPAVGSTPAGPGQLFQATVRAEPGSSTHLLMNLPGPLTVLPFGTLWLGQGSLVLDSGIMPAAGVRSTSVTLPTSLPPNLPVVLQSITTLTNGELWIGPPTLEVLR